jgi:hypothetical protein
MQNGYQLANFYLHDFPWDPFLMYLYTGSWRESIQSHIPSLKPSLEPIHCQKGTTGSASYQWRAWNDLCSEWNQHEAASGDISFSPSCYRILH